MVPIPSTVGRHLRTAALLVGLAAAATLLLLGTEVRPAVDPATSAGFGRDVEVVVFRAFAGYVLVGVLLAWRWPLPGAAVIASAALMLGYFVDRQFSTIVLLVVWGLLALPAVLLWLDWQRARPPGRGATSLAGAGVLLVALWFGADAIHDTYRGPTHPESSAPEVPADMVEWVWLGALGPDGVTAVVGLVEGRTGEVALVVEPAAGGAPTRARARGGADPAHRVRAGGLVPDTEYAFHVEVDGQPDRGRGRGRFRTAPDGPASFRFVVGACARTGSNGAVFDALAAEDPLFYLNLGDIHYANLSSTDPADHRAAYERLLTRPAQAALYRRVPIAYVWDDHDYGENDSAGDAPGRAAVRRAYRQVVPHHPLVIEDDGPIHQAFTIGRVRFVLTDSRSERTGTTMLGGPQLEWLVDELVRASQTHALVIWGNPVPWNGEPDPGADGWRGFPDERRQIADALAAAEVDNLVMVAGDAHMVALDDGSNTDFSTDGSGGFPLLHAAALDRRGQVKAGPYSAGAFPGGGRYGVVDVVDDGTTVAVTLTGRTWDGETLVQQTFTFS